MSEEATSCHRLKPVKLPIRIVLCLNVGTLMGRCPGVEIGSSAVY